MEKVEKTGGCPGEKEGVFKGFFCVEKQRGDGRSKTGRRRARDQSLIGERLFWSDALSFRERSRLSIKSVESRTSAVFFGWIGNMD